MRERPLSAWAPAACGLCCAGPALALLAAIGLGTVLGVVAVGVVGLLIVLLAVPVLRRRRAERCADPAGPVAVAAPTIRRRS